MTCSTQIDYKFYILIFYISDKVHDNMFFRLNEFGSCSRKERFKKKAFRNMYFQ